MRKVETIRTYSQIKLPADSRRLEILRHIMAAPATLSQLARAMKQSPARIHHHIKLLELAELVDIAEIRVTGTVPEKYYRARAGALFLQELILPIGKQPNLIFSESHDLAMEIVASSVSSHMNLLNFIPLFEERYDLVLPREQRKMLAPLLDFLQTSAFRTKLNQLAGYAGVHSGEQIPL